ncbi:MAG: DEAD/DEAH box helicase, partial [Bacteroidota bacterium]
MNPFARLGLSEPILRVIEELGFEEPSEIQSRAVPQLLADERDFIGLAQTGTGKTAAFGWPLLERIDVAQNHTQALILSPTRELSLQITKELEIFGKYLPKVNTLTVYGGSSIQEQIRALKKPQHIIIATPGRLIDLIKKRAVKLNQIRFLVLDEADEMLNMGFKEELDEILQFTPDSKQTWLFSATMAKDIRRIVDTYMDKPYEVRTNTKNEVNTNIDHQFALVKNTDKAEALMRFMDVQPDLRGVVFCRTRKETQSLAEELLRR